MQCFTRPLTAALMVVALAYLFVPNQSLAASAPEIDRDVSNALSDLYKKNSGAKILGKEAKGVLVFPSIVKGGLIIGGQYGEGALRKKGKTAGYYNTVAVSYGLQAGAQKFGYAMFFMTDAALKYLDRTEGWEVGTAPNLVVADKGIAGTLSTSSARKAIYVFFFNQRGLMAGIGIQGTKVTKIAR